MYFITFAYTFLVPDFIIQRFMGTGWFPAVFVVTKRICFRQNWGRLQPAETHTDHIHSCLWLVKNSQNKMLNLNRGVSVIWCVTVATTLWQTIWWSAVDTYGKIASHSELIRVVCVVKEDLLQSGNWKPKFQHFFIIHHWFTEDGKAVVLWCSRWCTRKCVSDTFMD